MKSVCWGIPVIRDIDPGVYKNHLAVAIYCYEKQVCTITGIAMPEDMHIVKARNMVVKVVKQNRFDYLFFVAQDIILPVNTLQILMSHDLPVVSGMYFSKGAPFTPVHYKEKADTKETGFYKRLVQWEPGVGEVEFTGLDCMLLKREVLEALSYPYFDLIYADGTEDSFFCQKVLEAGFKIHLDTRVSLIHLGKRMQYDEQMYLKHKRSFVIEVDNEK